MSARERLTETLRNPGLVGLDEGEATELLDAFTHELAEQIRAEYGKPRWPDEEPEYAYGYNAATHDAADLIDPLSAGPVRPGEETTP